MAASRKSDAPRAAGHGRLGLVLDAREPRPSIIAEGLLIHFTIEGEAGRSWGLQAIYSTPM
jgi:hypothetical protein